MAHPPAKTDFDPHDPGLAPVQHEVLSTMLQSCPVGWSEAHGGFWTIAKFDDVVASARDYAVFSVAQGVMVPATGASTPVPPVQVDPPEHADLLIGHALCGEERPLVKARDIRSEKARRAPTMIEDFDAYLAAMGVARERQLDAKFCGARKGIWIMRE